MGDAERVSSIEQMRDGPPKFFSKRTILKKRRFGEDVLPHYAKRIASGLLRIALRLTHGCNSGSDQDFLEFFEFARQVNEMNEKRAIIVAGSWLSCNENKRRLRGATVPIQPHSFWVLPPPPSLPPSSKRLRLRKFSTLKPFRAETLWRMLRCIGHTITSSTAAASHRITLLPRITALRRPQHAMASFEPPPILHACVVFLHGSGACPHLSEPVARSHSDLLQATMASAFAIG
jgi:hypothetical protein